MKYVIPFFGFLLFSQLASGQVTDGPAEQRTNSLSLSWGYQHLGRQDQIFSPFVHRGGSALTAAVAYERRREHWTHRLDLDFSLLEATFGDTYSYTRLPDTDEILTTYPHQFVLVDLAYGMTRRLNPAGDSGRFFAGGVLHNTVNAVDYSFGPFGTFGYFAAFSLGARAGGEARLGDRSRLSLSLDLPLLSWTARSPFLANDDEYIENNYSHNGLKTFFAYLGDGRLQTLNRHQQLDLRLGYALALSSSWDLLAGYRLQFIRNAEPLVLVSRQQQFTLGANLKF